MLKITTLPEAWGEQVRPAPRPPNRQARFPPPLVQGLAATILQFAPLKMVPDSLGRIKLRRVAGQLFQVQAGRHSRGEEVIHGLRAVCAPSQMTKSLPGIWRSSYRRKLTTAGQRKASS